MNHVCMIEAIPTAQMRVAVRYSKKPVPNADRNSGIRGCWRNARLQPCHASRAQKLKRNKIFAYDISSTI